MSISRPPVRHRARIAGLRTSRKASSSLSTLGTGIEGLEARTLLAANLSSLVSTTGRVVQVDPHVFNVLGQQLAFLASDYQTYVQAHPAIRTPGNYQVPSDEPGAGALGIENSRVMVDAVAKGGDVAALQSQITALGGQVTGAFGTLVSASVPVWDVEALASLPALFSARPAAPSTSNAGLVDSQAAVALKSDVASTQYGATGAGVTVGVLSDSYNRLNGAAKDVNTGDLPTGVNVLQEGNNNSDEDEGRAMLQLVHDIAPDAGLAFNTARLGQAGFAAAILNLAKPTTSGGGGASVIVDDWQYFDEPMFQDGPVAQAVDQAVNTYGVSYFSSAGNSARHSYEAPFNSTTVTTNPAWESGLNFTPPPTFHNFNTGGSPDIYQPITIAGFRSIYLSLQWDQPYAIAGGAGSTNDVDAYLLNANKTTRLAQSIDNNVSTGNPIEDIIYTNNTATPVTVYLAINLYSGAAPGDMKYVIFQDGNSSIIGYPTNSSASFGHAQAANAAGVGAAPYYSTPNYGTSPAQLESFSSAGGTPILFNANGSRLATPENRYQPRFVSVDGIDTTFFGDDDLNGLPNFFGTSAAAPDAAAVAALMKSAVPSLTAQQIYTALQNTALDMGTPGYDTDSGYGLIQADKALAYVLGSAITGTVFQDANKNGVMDGTDFGSPGATVFLDSNHNGALDSGTSSFSSTVVPVTIPDGVYLTPSRVSSSLDVSGLTGRLTNVVVHLSATTSSAGDLGFTLISPSGIRVQLSLTVGGDGDNYVNTVFSDNGASRIENNSAPFTGTFIPYSRLASLIGDDPNGTWQLEARDYIGNGMTGTLTSWSLDLSYADPSTTTNVSGQYLFSGLPFSSYYGIYDVRQVLPAGRVETLPASPYQYILYSPTILTSIDFGQGAPSNTVPTAFASTVTTTDDGRASVTLNGTDAETPVSALVFTITSLPLKGTLFKPDGTAVHVGDTFTGSPQTLNYVLGTATFGAVSDTFQYTVTDNGLNGDSSTVLTSAPATVTVQTPANSTGVLRILGTSGGDTIALIPSGTGARITVNGVDVTGVFQTSAVNQVRIYGEDGNDTFNLGYATAFSISVYGQQGNDTLNTTLDNVNYDGGIGTNSAVLSGTSSADTFNVGSASITAGGTTIAYLNTKMDLKGLDGDDIFKIAAGVVLPGSIDGGNGYNTIDESAFTTAIAANLTNSTITGLAGTFTNVRSLLGGSEANTLTGPATATTFTISAANAGTVGNVAFNKFANLVGGTANDVFKFSSGATLSGTVDGGGGSNTIDESTFTTNVNVNIGTSTVSSLSGTFTNIKTVIGGTGSNALTGPTTDTIYNISGANSGNVAGISFVNFSAMIAGPGNDTFKFSNGASVTGTLYGGAGANTIDQSAYITSITVNVITGVITGVGAPFTRIQTFVGGTGSNTFYGPGAGSIYNINAANTATAGTFGFSKYGNLVGGNSNDVFLFAPGGSITGTINGGGGSNTIDESLLTTNVNANVGTSTISGLGGTYTNINKLIGGGGSNALTGPTTDTIYNVTGANSGNVAGISFSNFGSMIAGPGNDTFKFSNGASVTGTLYGGAGTNTLDQTAYTTALSTNVITGINTVAGAPFTRIQTFLGGTGANTFYGPGAGSTYTINAANTATVGTFNFVRYGNLVGGGSNDVFKIVPGGSLTGTLDGGGGTNTIDESAFTTNVNANLGTSMVSAVGGTFTNIKTINAGSGSNALTGPSADATFSITGANVITVGGITFNGFGALIGGPANDIFKFSIGGSVSASVYGGSGSNTIDESAFTVPVVANLANSTINGVGTTFSKIATIIGGTGSNTLNGPSAGSTFTINGSNAGNVGGVAFSKFANLVGGAGNDIFKFNPGGTLGSTIDGGGGNNVIDESAIGTNVNANLVTSTITGLGGTFSNIKILTGGTGFNALTGPSAGATYYITNLNSGNVAGFFFNNFGSMIAGAGNDTFSFSSNGGLLTGTIYGGGGSNTIDQSTVPNDITANLTTSTITFVGAPFSKIQTILAGGGNNTLTGPAAGSTFNITSRNVGTVGNISFSAFGTLNGGTGNDTFVIGASATLSGGINGGGGIDSLDYGSWISSVTINLATGAANGIGTTVTNIQNVRGGSSSDTLTGSSLGGVLIGGGGTDTLNGGAGRSILIGGTGSDTVNGGSDDDILIGGTTGFDGNFSALDAILAEWQSVDSYATRVNLIKNGGGLNGPNKLVWGTTVLDDSAVDTLLGSTGNDWFFVGSGDTDDRQSGEQVN